MKFVGAATLALITSTNFASAAPLTLACKVQAAPGLVDPTHGQIVDLPVLIDPEHGTANQMPAAITEALVTWTDSSDGPANSLNYILDRKRSTLSIDDDKGRELLAGNCVASEPQPSRSPLPPTQPAPFTLACEIEMAEPLTRGHHDGGRTSFLIDPGAGTVNGMPAAITNTRIRWTGPGKGATTTIIDRTTGGLAVVERGGILLLTGSCELAEGRKF